MVNLPLDLDTLQEELAAILKIVAKWEEKIRSEPLPGHDAPGTEEQLEGVFIMLRGELRMAGRKCEALAEAFDDF